MIRLNRNSIIFFTVFLVTFIIGCSSEPMDVLVAADGTVLTGELLSIQSGKAIFSTGSVDIPDYGRVWCLDGSSFVGEILASNGFFESGAFSVPEDSVYQVDWMDSDFLQETFSVDAALGWIDTGIVLEQGDIFSLHGSGFVFTETGSSTPDGQDKFSSSVALVPGATSGQLVFKVGSDLPVAAGDSWLGESPANGSLALAVNVPLENSSESHGIYTVTVNACINRDHSSAYSFYPASR